MGDEYTNKKKKVISQNSKDWVKKGQKQSRTNKKNERMNEWGEVKTIQEL